MLCVSCQWFASNCCWGEWGPLGIRVNCVSWNTRRLASLYIAPYDMPLHTRRLIWIPKYAIFERRYLTKHHFGYPGIHVNFQGCNCHTQRNWLLVSVGLLVGSDLGEEVGYLKIPSEWKVSKLPSCPNSFSQQRDECNNSIYIYM